MKFALLQFCVSKKPHENYQTIKDAIVESAENGAKILVTQECALSGYPPIEIDSVDTIDFDEQEKTFQEIRTLVKAKQIFMVLRLIRKENAALKNSIAIISPDGSINYYDKRALWGWDQETFEPGVNQSGIFTVDEIKIGIRVCFEVRFPEYFRELYKENVDVAIVSFNDLAQMPNPDRLNMIKSHLLTRAVENAFTVISVNATTMYQTAPTCVIDPDGQTLVEAPLNEISITYYTYEKNQAGFGAQGRMHYSNKFVGI